MKGKSNTLAVDYVLPDYTNVKRGYVRQSGEKGQQGEQVSASKIQYRKKTFIGKYINFKFCLLLEL